MCIVPLSLLVLSLSSLSLNAIVFSNELFVLYQHSSCAVAKDMVISAHSIRLPLSSSSVLQRIIILFGKYDNLQVSINKYSFSSVL